MTGWMIMMYFDSITVFLSSNALYAIVYESTYSFFHFYHNPSIILVRVHETMVGIHVIEQCPACYPTLPGSYMFRTALHQRLVGARLVMGV